MLDAGLVTIIAQRLGLKVWGSFLERACCEKKTVYLNGGWRGGKSASAAFILFLRIFLIWLRREGTHLIWLIGPDYEQARPEFFYISQWAAALNLTVEASSASQGSLRMTISWAGHPGVVEIVTKSATDPTSLGGVAPVEILMCEAGQISEEGNMWVDGRTAEKNANVIKAGTFENDEGKQQFAWFEEESNSIWNSPTSRAQAFRLPTWENEFIYGSCLGMIEGDASLGQWCPDGDHGPSHSALHHPMIRQLADKWKGRPRDWAKRFGGEPQGLRDPMYEWAIQRPTFYLKKMPEELKTANMGRSPVWQTTAGGIDPGLVHPAALTVGSVVRSGPYAGQTWVRRCIEDTSGSADSMWQAKDFLQKRYGVSKWGGDPVGLQYTRDYENIEAMRGSLYARMARVKIVNGVAQDEMVFFDADDPGVVLLFSQIGRIHFRKDANGQLVYDRTKDDDMVASFENMMAMLHGQPVLHIPKRWRLPALPPVGAR